LLAGLAVVLAVWRFATGIGSISNLSQGYGWGFWIGFDILAGIALAAGGFVVAGFVHIFGGEKYHPLVRPAITTAFLGYLMFIAGLLVDIGRPWTIWHMIVFWHHESPMFEVGWCVMMYTTVLFIEFLPSVLERFGWARLISLWRDFSPWIVWIMLSLFAYALSGSMKWLLVIAGVLFLFEVLVRTGFFERDPRSPTILITAGVIFSTLHQSSLGTVFVMMPHRLDTIWYTPILPVIFFISAVMAGLGMTMVEATWTARSFKREPETHLLRGLGKALSWVILFYLIVRIADVVTRGATGEVFAFSIDAIGFWLEMILGLVIPLVILLGKGVNTSKGQLWAGLFVVAGLIIHRLNVSITGISAQFAENYRPHWMEVAVSVGIVAAGILAYRVFVLYLPILEDGPQASVQRARGSDR
jgi:formate dehydrogenase iron-sulfur subunit